MRRSWLSFPASERNPAQQSSDSATALSIAEPSPHRMRGNASECDNADAPTRFVNAYRWVRDTLRYQPKHNRPFGPDHGSARSGGNRAAGTGRSARCPRRILAAGHDVRHAGQRTAGRCHHGETAGSRRIRQAGDHSVADRHVGRFRGNQPGHRPPRSSCPNCGAVRWSGWGVCSAWYGDDVRRGSGIRDRPGNRGALDRRLPCSMPANFVPMFGSAPSMSSFSR